MRITSGENSTISEGGILLLLFTLSCRYNTLSVVTKSAEFLRRPGKPSLFNRVGKHDAFHPIVNFTNIAAGIHSTNDGIGVPSVPTTNRHGRLLTTGTAVGCCLEYCLHRTKSTVVVSTREKHTCCLERCQSNDPQTYAIRKEQSNKEPP